MPRRVSDSCIRAAGLRPRHRIVAVAGVALAIPADPQEHDEPTV
ncbi:MAG: hypothetical protein QOG56_2189 [Solirubrobacteraceae bacterium]|jgi:hypothetical protein|nr:hypothetical protein [Solirubrobacteraceae bacterium]